MIKHTPGPWIFDGREVVDSHDNTIALVNSLNQWNTTEGIVEEKMPWEANARLIAAAPEMLRLIQRLTSPYMAEPEYRMDAFIDANEIVKQITQGDD